VSQDTFAKIKGAEANPKGKTVNTKYLNLVTPENFHTKTDEN